MSLGGGIIFETGRDITVDETAVIELQPTDRYLRITAATASITPRIAGFKPTASFVIQDRAFILENATSSTILLGDQDTGTADYEDQIRANSTVTFLAGRVVIMHYHIGTLGWYILGR